MTRADPTACRQTRAQEVSSSAFATVSASILCVHACVYVCACMCVCVCACMCVCTRLACMLGQFVLIIAMSICVRSTELLLPGGHEDMKLRLVREGRDG